MTPLESLVFWIRLPRNEVNEITKKKKKRKKKRKRKQTKKRKRKKKNEKREKNTHWISNDSYNKIKTQIYFLLAPFSSSLRTSFCLPLTPPIFVSFPPLKLPLLRVLCPRPLLRIGPKITGWTTPNPHKPSLLFLQSCQTSGRIKVLIIIVRSNQIIICCNKPILCIFYYKEAKKYCTLLWLSNA